MQPLSVVGAILAALAALVHVMIFVFESVTWSRPATWKRFGLRTQDEADVTRPLAYNQGFYNLFLAIGAGLGVVLLVGSGVREAGLAIALFALGSMLLASIVLITSNPKLARAAATQGVLPLLAIGCLVAGAAAA